MTNKLTPPLVAAAPNYKFQYTPIYIEFVSPVLIVDGEDDTDPFLQGLAPAKLKITNPSSVLPGGKQSFSRTQFVSLPEDGPLKLKLVPSDIYVPQGVYRVDYLFFNNKIPIESQNWIVPFAPDLKTIEIVSSGVEDTIPHPESDVVFSISSHTRGDEEYTLDGDVITWANPPAEGEVYNVTYQPGVTLSELIHYD